MRISREIKFLNLGDGSSNVVISPFSIEQSLSIIALAANGNTSTELQALLGHKSDFLLESLSSHSKSYITANRVYVYSDRSLNEEFQSTIEKRVGYAVAESIDFRNNYRAALKINGWIANQTDQKIQDLINPDAITGDTRVVLVNAIYFKGNWKYKFEKENTFTDDFYVTETQKKPMEFMQLKTDFRYNEFKDLDATCVELPYEDENVAMYVVLPRKRTGLKDVLQKFYKIDFHTEIVENLIEQKVDVTLPRFTTEFSTNLNTALKKMGAKTIFSGKADFSNLVNSPEPIELSEVIHKAVLEVNEDGVVGAAATEEVLVSRCAPICEYLEADHPFLYVIYDRNARQMLFLGEFHS
ncbi:serine protease inhibitor 42Dd-like [Culicoides brevitarsis]|uniref:serine protease inhibitor 42Dd-like n=1 Tax=Culicoides brevitarsis TaxID=469753 RepID=UPI00307BCF2D